VYVDGKFGNNTKNAVMEFQRTHKDEFGNPLAVDGIVGKLTWIELMK
jgi:peptidoglycan hydrolase-like protein with peptidoglycan-binding domain